MKRLLILIAIVFCFAAQSTASELVQTKIFQWQQPNLNLVKDWELQWGNVSGGPYALLATFGYIGESALDYQGSTSTVVQGSPASNVIKYFVMRACGDVPQQDGTILRKCSPWSNEISHDFWIPFDGFEAPVQFIIKAEESAA